MIAKLESPSLNVLPGFVVTIYSTHNALGLVIPHTGFEMYFTPQNNQLSIHRNKV